MIVLFHAIWYVITELLLPAWQKEAKDITYQVIKPRSHRLRGFLLCLRFNFFFVGN